MLYAMISGQPPLTPEAGWAGMLTAHGDLRLDAYTEFVRMLGGVRPVALTELFQANPGWPVDGLKELSAEARSPRRPMSVR
ncbi:hypothetical protein SAMN05661093_03074 [Kibdelosporangium aridum]|uniref:Uncharacterized protein n=2 Tax=Kibdelosporangium aridum TaxID=2030 RepID=A0A1W2DCH8_KIBAR|nr:hypothetical protein SAMN05661093_03074 [Kibdelosporangium aridum]